MSSNLLQTFEQNVIADVKIAGESLKTALHNLEVEAAKAVSACIQGHDATPAISAVHATVNAFKSAFAKAETDVVTEATADVKTDLQAAETTALEATAAAVSDVSTGKIANALTDVEKTVAGSPLATEVEQQVGAVIDTVAKDAADASAPLGQ